MAARTSEATVIDRPDRPRVSLVALPYVVPRLAALAIAAGFVLVALRCAQVIP